MSVLSDQDLLAVLASGELTITTPFWKPFDPEVQVQPCSIDLRLGNEFVFEEEWLCDSDGRIVHGAHRAHRRDLRVCMGNSVVIPPLGFVLATTLERVALGPGLRGVVCGRSSIGRLGLFVENAGFIDCGFAGQITLELFNASRFPFELTTGQRCCQLEVSRLSSPARRPYGHPERQSKYQDQSGVTPSRLEKVGD